MKILSPVVVPAEPEVADLHDSMVVLSEALRQLGERVEILEARELLHRAISR